jgi:hypothetical protein
LSTWHSCFVCASDTVAFTGQLVAESGLAHARADRVTASTLVQRTMSDAVLRASAWRL